MLDCPSCGSALLLTAPACACGAANVPALDGVGLVCGACERFLAPGAVACACGAPAGVAGGWVATAPPAVGREASEADAAPPGPAAAPTPAPSPRAPEAPPMLRRRPAQPPPPPPPVQAAPPPTAVRIASHRPDGSVLSVPLEAAPVLCGRGEDCDLLFDSDGVSRRHARFTRAEIGITVEDLGSLNGTWLRLRGRRPLAFGDEFRAGSRRFRLAWTPDGATLEELEAEGRVAHSWRLRAGNTVIGRAGDVAFRGDAELALCHARLDTAGEAPGITDLSTESGTWVRVVAPARVDAGDELRLGTERVRIEAGG
jgi:hypothetical protein